MDIKFETTIFLAERRGDCVSKIEGEQYALEQLGGEIPKVGDTIRSVWISPGDKQLLYEVVRRYFAPENPRDPNKHPIQTVYIQVVLEVRLIEGNSSALD